MDIQTLLENVDLLKYVSQYVEMNEDNGEWFGVCPFHGDTDPSFSISPDKNPYVYYCFGCQASSNVLGFIQKYHHVSFPRAIKMAAEFAGIMEDITHSGAADALRIFKQFAPRKRTEKKPEYIILSPDYMLRYEFDLEKLQPWIDEGISIAAMDKFGVMYDRANERIVFPLRNGDGNIVGVSGRTVDPLWKQKGLRKYTYVHKMGLIDFIYGLYENLNSILEKREIIVFEGAKSVMKACSWGVPNTGAVLTSHLNEQQMNLLLRLGCAVTFALDKGIDIAQDKNIKRLRQFVPVYYIKDTDGLLEDKEAPVDRGVEVFKKLYEGRRRFK